MTSLLPNLAIAEKRLALVIGNSNYQQFPLANPVNDALDMTAALRKVGFEVESYVDLDRSEMGQAIRLFGDKLKRADVGLFYYAGHGVQVKGRNYLVPLKVDIQSADEVEYESIDAGAILQKMETAGNDVNIVILDACRNNPFAKNFRSMNRGLAKMDGPTGSIIAYATAPGSVAADGSGRNGVYTKYLLEMLNQPGLAIEQTFKRVRNAVMQETGGKQIPWESSSLMGEFKFLDKTNTVSALTTKRRPPAPVATKKYLQVITNVPNAKVIINNIERGFVNSQGILNIENILENRVDVQVQAEGFKTEQHMVALTPNKWEQLNIVLTPIQSLESVDNRQRQTVSYACVENERAIVTTKVEFNLDNGKSKVKRNLAELNILLMQSLTKYGLNFSNIDISGNINQTKGKYKAALSRAIKQFNPRYIFKYSSIINEKPIKIIHTNMKTISGDLSLEMIDVKSREIIGYATKSFTQAGMDKKAILRKVLSREVNMLTENVMKKVCALKER